MTVYREPDALDKLRYRLFTGLSILGIQLAFFAWADHLKRQHPSWFAETYTCDAIVFLLTLAPSLLVVGLGLLALMRINLVLAVYKSLDVKDLIAEGSEIEQELRRRESEGDVAKFTEASKRAMQWQRVDLQAALASNPELRTAFEGAVYQPKPYPTTWGFAEQWVPALDRDVGRLRDALRTMNNP